MGMQPVPVTQGSVLYLVLCCHCCEVLNFFVKFLNKEPHIFIILGPANYVTSPRDRQVKYSVIHAKTEEVRQGEGLQTQSPS